MWKTYTQGSQTGCVALSTFPSRQIKHRISHFLVSSAQVGRHSTPASVELLKRSLCGFMMAETPIQFSCKTLQDPVLLRVCVNVCVCPDSLLSDLYQVIDERDAVIDIQRGHLSPPSPPALLSHSPSPAIVSISLSVFTVSAFCFSRSSSHRRRYLSLLPLLCDFLTFFPCAVWNFISFFFSHAPFITHTHTQSQWSAQTVLQCLSPIKQIPVWLQTGGQTIKLFSASSLPPLLLLSCFSSGRRRGWHQSASNTYALTIPQMRKPSALQSSPDLHLEPL